VRAAVAVSRRLYVPLSAVASAVAVVPAVAAGQRFTLRFLLLLLLLLNRWLLLLNSRFAFRFSLLLLLLLLNRWLLLLNSRFAFGFLLLLLLLLLLLNDCRLLGLLLRLLTLSFLLLLYLLRICAAVDSLLDALLILELANLSLTTLIALSSLRSQRLNSHLALLRRHRLILPLLSGRNRQTVLLNGGDSLPAIVYLKLTFSFRLRHRFSLERSRIASHDRGSDRVLTRNNRAAESLIIGHTDSLPA
jgi:hypothetical protein